MRIAIDCRGLRKKSTGIPNFVVTAINGIAQQKPDWELYLLANSAFSEDLDRKLLKRENVKVIIEPLRWLPNYAILWYFTKVNDIINRLNPDLFWAPSFLLPPFLPKRFKKLVTVHDLVFKQYKDTMPRFYRIFFDLLHDSSIKQADMLWANSNYTKEGVEHFFPDRACRQIFTGFFINTDVFQKTEIREEEKRQLLQKYNLGEKFLLFVGTLEPRKNLEFLLSLMPELAKDGYTLLIIGAQGWGNTNIRSVIEAPAYPRDKVCFAGFVSTDELVKLYHLAAVYVSTSHNEGFGMPQLEAMACGCPVVSPHNSAMIEVVAGAGETVKGWEETDWVQTINKVFVNRQSYIEKGFRRVEEYKRDFVIDNLIKYIEKNMS